MSVANPLPYRAVTVTAPSTSALVSTALMRGWVRQNSSIDDDFLTSLLSAASDYIEDDTNRSLLKQSVRLSLDDWPSGRSIPLPRGPLYSSTGVSVTYIARDGSTNTLAASNYVVAADGPTPRVVLKETQSWPTTPLRAADAVRVAYEAGSTSAPEQAVHAARLLVTHWYDNRSAVEVGTITKPIEMAVDAILSHLRIPEVA